MKPISMCTLEVRIGKCNLNLKSDGFFGVSLQMGKNVSSISPIKKIQNNAIAFNTTLRMNVEKQLIEQQAGVKVCVGLIILQCRALLHLVRQNRERKVIGIATVDITQFRNQGFKYHQFGQCADYQADIQVSISFGVSFQLGVKSQIGYFYTSQSNVYEGNNLEQSRDSILDNSDYNILKQSKAISHIEPYSMNRPKRQSLRIKPRRTNDIKKLRKSKPQNFSSCAPQQIITHYETELKNFEQQLKERDEWATGMKVLIQELEAQNQLLKELTIDEMEANNINNLEQGIDYVSKFVHSKFQASRSMIYESPKSQQRTELQTPQNQNIQNQLKYQEHQAGEQKCAQQQKSLKQTKSYKQLPESQISPRMQNSPQRSAILQKLPVLQSRQQLQNALKILTGGQTSKEEMLQNTKISELQEELFRLRQQKQELYDMTEQLYSESKNIKLQRDSLQKDVKQLESQIEKMHHYIEQIKCENFKIKEENQKYQRNSKTEEYQKLSNLNLSLQEKSKELERQLKESLKAIEEFKNDALNARSELITKEDELNNYKSKFGELGSMTDLIMKNIQLNNQQTSGQKQLDIEKFVYQSPCKGDNSTSACSSNLHLLYSQVLQSSIASRRQLQESLSKIIGSRTEQFLGTMSPLKKQQNLKRLQTQINRMFVGVLRSNSDIRNMKELQKCKYEVSKLIQELMATL